MMDSLYINCILIICVTGGGSDWYHGTRILMTCALIAIFLQEFALIGFLCINELEQYRQKLAGAILGFSFVTGDGRFFYLSFILFFFPFLNKYFIYLFIYFFIYGCAYHYIPVYHFITREASPSFSPSVCLCICPSSCLHVSLLVHYKYDVHHELH